MRFKEQNQENHLEEEQAAIFVEKKYREIIAVGIFLVMAVNLFAGGAISAIMPKMAEQLGGMELYGLVFTVSTIFMALCSPIAGKFGDLYGKTKMFFLGSIISIAGTVAIGFAPSMLIVVILRAVSGIGNAFALCLGLILIGSIFPSAQRIKWLGFYGTTNAVCNMLGPVFGGMMADSIGWPWVFFVTLPVGIIGLFIVMKFMPKMTVIHSDSQLDTFGIAAFAVLLIGIMMFCQWGGTKFAWLSWKTLAMAAVIVIVTAAFVRIEKKRGDNALMPMTLMSNPVFSTALISIILTTASTLSVYMYLALYMQTVIGCSATAAALPVTIQSLVGLPGSAVFGSVMSKLGTKAIKPSALLAVSIVGAVNLVYALFITPDTGVMFIYVIQVIYGVGATIIMTVYHMAVQNLIPEEQMGIATSTIQMGQTMGASVGLAVFGAVLNVNADTAVSLKWIFLTASMIAGIAFLATMFMRTNVKNQEWSLK